MPPEAPKPAGTRAAAVPPPAWLEIRRGCAPLAVSFPHTGTEIPEDIATRLESTWLGRKDTDWWVHRLYDMANELDATTVRTAISRTVIDVNRDPSGASLYPGQATTGLCPVTTFDGEALYRADGPASRDRRIPELDPSEIATRRARYFEPYHAALAAEVERLRAQHGCVVLYDAHSIRSRIPRLFEGLLPHFNIGTNGGATCDAELTAAVERACDHPPFTRVTDGRFKGGWTVRRHADPTRGVHAIQMELACRSYLDEPEAPTPANWPSEYSPARAQSARTVLIGVLAACIQFARIRSGEPV